MVSGFLTSPCDHWRMSSAVARPIRSSSKKLTSSTGSYPSSGVWLSDVVCGEPGPLLAPARPLDLLDAARLPPGQVDTQLFRGAEDLVVRVAHLDLDAVAREDLHVEAERLELLEEHLERLRDAGLGDVLALDDGLVDLDPAEDVVGLDGEQLLQRVRGAVGLHRPALHLTEALATELRLTTQRLLRDHRVR